MAVHRALNERHTFSVGGLPANAYRVFWYNAGSTTKAATFNSAAGTVPNANPMVLDANGGFSTEVWLTAGVSYKAVLALPGVDDPPTSTIWSEDSITGINDTATAIIDQWISGPLPTYISATSFSLVGDQTTVFEPGRRVKTTNTAGTIYSTILTSTFSVGVTTVTVSNDSGILDAGLSAVGYGITSFTNSSSPNQLPPGVFMPWASSNTNPPNGWLYCNGAAVSRVTYAALFVIAGTTFGAGDGTTTFNLPDMRGRAPFGHDSMGSTPASRLTNAASTVDGNVVGASGGSQLMHGHTHTETAAHSHAQHAQTWMNIVGSVNQQVNTGTIYNLNTETAGGRTVQNTVAASITLNSTGGGTAQNMPPALVVKYIIKT